MRCSRSDSGGAEDGIVPHPREDGTGAAADDETADNMDEDIAEGGRALDVTLGDEAMPSMA